MSVLAEKLKKFRNETETESDTTPDFTRTSSTLGAYFNVVCVIAGTGTLGLPQTLAQSGWTAIAFIVLSACIAFYTGNLLIQCLYYKPEHRLHSYPDIGEAAFGKWGRIFVQVFHYAILLGVACLFIILTGINAEAVSNHFGGDLPTKIWIIIAGVIILVPYSLFKTLREVGFLSIFGALATLVVIIVSVVVGLLEPNKSVDQEPIILSGIPLALATIGFSFGGNVVYPHVEASMRHPQHWKRMLFSALTTISLMYILVGIVGYYVYGATVKSPIMQSLPEELPSIIATLFITLHVISASPILLCSFSLEIENSFGINRHHMSPRKEFIIRFATRVATVSLLTLIAAFVPFFSSFMSLVGALANCMIVFVIPIVCHLKLFGIRNRPIWEYIWIPIVLAVAFIGCILGAIDAIRELHANFQGAAS